VATLFQIGIWSSTLRMSETETGITAISILVRSATNPPRRVSYEIRIAGQRGRVSFPVTLPAFGRAAGFGFDRPACSPRRQRCYHLAHLIQCAPTARFTSGGRIHPGSCR
jgi:hypothetical protein